jgi:two-component system NtrC family sensor kinase
MYDFAKFTDSNIADCGRNLRSAASSASSLQDAASKIVGYLYDNITDSAGQKANAMVRFFKVHSYHKLDAVMQGYVRGFLFAHSGPGSNPGPDDILPCLTLMGTIGDLEEWTFRRKSIPLVSADIVTNVPMFVRLFNQFGIDIDSVIRPDPTLIGDLSKKTFNTFYVPEAVGSPYVPGQDGFVIPFGVKSALGFGGFFSTGELFFVVMFSKVSIPSNVASAFSKVALSVKEAVEPFVDDRLS